MHVAAFHGHLDCVVELLKGGADISAKANVRLRRR